MTNKRGREKAEVAEGTAHTDVQRRIIYDSSNIRSVYANVAKLSAGREEIILQFGIDQSQNAPERESGVLLTASITLNPFTAKRLALLLDNALQDYEVEYGPLDKGFSSNPDISEPESTDEKARLLFQLVGELDVQIGIERSFKIFDQSILANRFLLGFKKDTISGDSSEKILDICERMDMPGNCLEAFRENLSEANIVLFGFEKNETNRLYKAYLEFGGRFEKLIKDNPDKPEPFLIHQGFKWDASDNRRCARAEYICFPSFSVEKMLERLSGFFILGRAITPLKS